MPAQFNSYVATVDIPVSVFVRRTPGSDFGMQPCVAGEDADIGVSHEGTQLTQLPGDTGPAIAAQTGTSCKTYGPDETCEVIAGAAINAGDKLAPDANGHAVVAAANAKYSAIANVSVANAGEKVLVTLQRGTA